jgi:23S rRNA (uracil-5-)-methyltransferase RumA
MKFGDRTTLKIEKMDAKGRGCGSVNGRVACAYFTAPGEEVEATLMARRQGKLSLRLDSVVKASPSRVAPPCPDAGKCGGCPWQMFDYPSQLEWKRSILNDALEAGGLGRQVESILPCPQLSYYRNRMDYCVGHRGELGLKEPGAWNRYLNLDSCQMLSSEAVSLMRAFRKWMVSSGAEPWDAKKESGLIRYLVIREGRNTGERMATVVTAAGEIPAEGALVESLRPFATTVYRGINPAITDISVASELILLHGKPELTEKVGGKTYLITPNSFFQTNTIMAGELLKTVRGFLTDAKPEKLLDLYCGVGFLSVGLAESAGRVLGVEIDEAAVAVARRNAEINGVENADFRPEKAEQLTWQDEGADAIIVDPPRSGLHPKVVKSLLAAAPGRLIYVSCKCASFANDWQGLKGRYKIDGLAALDLFPHSPHAELVISMRRI